MNQRHPNLRCQTLPILQIVKSLFAVQGVPLLAESRPVLQSTAYVASFSFFFIFLAKSIYYPIIISCGAACWGEANRAINYHLSSETWESAKDFLDIFDHLNLALPNHAVSNNRGAIRGKTGKTAILPWFCKIEYGGGSVILVKE